MAQLIKIRSGIIPLALLLTGACNESASFESPKHAFSVNGITCTSKSKQQGTDALMGFLCNSGGFRSHIEIKAHKEVIDGYYDRALIYAAQLGHDRVTRLMSIASTYDYRR